MIPFIKSLLQKLKKLLQFLLNPRFLLCFGIGWIITNGWAYFLFGLGSFTDVGWMTAVAAAYLAILWFPFTPEKIITLAIAIALLKWLFPRDTYTLGVLHDLRVKAVTSLREYTAQQKRNRIENRRRYYEKMALRGTTPPPPKDKDERQ